MADPGSLPGADVALSLAAHTWHSGFGLFVAAFLLFPSGRLASPGWRKVMWAVVVVYGGLALSGIFESGVEFSESPTAELHAGRPLFGGAVAGVANDVWAVLLTTNVALLVYG